MLDFSSIVGEIQTKKNGRRIGRSFTSLTDAPKRRQLMVGGGAVAVRYSDGDGSDDHASDNRGHDWHASDGTSKHWSWCWWRWRSGFSAGLGEGLNRNQAQDCCGSEKFFHGESLKRLEMLLRCSLVLSYYNHLPRCVRNILFLARIFAK
jgi:hypothetical protein